MDMVQHGDVALSDPVAIHLPSHVTVPQRNGRQITLQDLATHRSGLPRFPSNLKPRDPSNPFADYTVEQLYQFLSIHELTRDVDAKVEHSSVGLGLLGHALERRAGTDYESQIRTRILDPLGMSSTRISPSPDMKARLAPGHNRKLQRVSNWDVPTFAGAGGFQSTANDLLTFLTANLDHTTSPLGAAMTAVLRVRRGTGREGPIGWSAVTLDGVFSRDGRNMFVTSGATGGYRAFLGFDRKVRAGVVVFANALSVSGGLSGFYDFDNIGLHLLDSRWPLSGPSNEQRTE
jgi:CubicO group peptidase (beta-lactamase class C family)